MGLTDKIKIGLIGLVALVGLSSWVFSGAERIICLSDPTKKIAEYSFQDYSKDCKNPVSKTLAYIAYPSARLARYIHNSMVKD